MGSHLGWFFHALFGVGSYILSLYIGWVGWRLLFLQAASIISVLRSLYSWSLFILSLCMLLSLIERVSLRPQSHALRRFFIPAMAPKNALSSGRSSFLLSLSRSSLFQSQSYLQYAGGWFPLFSTLSPAFMFLAKITPSQTL